MADQTQRLTFLIDAQNRADAAFKSVEQGISGVKGKLDSMQPQFQTMAVAGTAAFAAIAGSVGVAIANYAEVERAQRQLEHAIVGVSKGTKAQLAEVLKITDALEKKSGIDADALNMGVAQLSTFGLQSKTVLKLTKSLADLTVNQNGVNASADQYISSANIMAKALNGQFGVLEKSGIRFTEMQQKIILTGTESQKAAALIEGLNQNLRETTTTLEKDGGIDVQMAKLSRSMGDVSDAVAKAMIPAFNELMDRVMPIISSIASWAEENPKLVETLTVAALVISGVTAALGFLGIALGAVSTAVTTLGITMAGVLTVSGVGLVVAGLVWIANNLKNIVGALYGVEITWTDVWNSMKSTVSSIGDWIGAKIEWLYEKFQKMMGFVKSVKEAVFGAEKMTAGNTAVGSSSVAGLQLSGIAASASSDLSSGLSSFGKSPQFNFTFNGDVVDRSLFINDVQKSLNRASTVRLVAGQ